MWVQSLGWEGPLEDVATQSVFLPGESHGQRSLVGHSPCECTELDMAEQLSSFTRSIKLTSGSKLGKWLEAGMI